jgi:hypothetical protein
MLSRLTWDKGSLSALGQLKESNAFDAHFAETTYMHIYPYIRTKTPFITFD